jgi:hypothetical protein
MREGKGKGGKAKLAATEDKQPRTNGLDLRAYYLQHDLIGYK